jgi:serine/threonine-protein kinase HipA
MLTFAHLKCVKVRNVSLYLIGENLDKSRGHYRAGTGKLVQLVRGVYIDADDDIDATLLKHAVRIAKYLYPTAYLSAASAVTLAPSRDGRLYISGRRNMRNRIRALEIVQNEAAKHPSLGSAVINDGMGEFRADVSSIRQRFLEAFRLRSEHSASIDDAMRENMASRLIEEYGTPRAAADAAWTLARENQWYREGELAERFLTRNASAVPVRNEAALDLTVAWHGEPIGHLRHDGFEWRWSPIEGEGPQLIRQTAPGKLPPFIASLLPEGWLESVLHDKDERAALRSGRRYMSNITIAENPAELAELPRDTLLTRLDRYTADGLFTGRYAGPGRNAMHKSFERNLARIYEHKDAPRLSGVQIKAPMYLDDKGILAPSIGKPFTHILKPAGTSGYEALPVIEWLAMTLGRAGDFTVPATALLTMPDDMPPALVVERFDIRDGLQDRRMIALEDLCAVLGLPTAAKYDGTIERIARAVRPLSTAPDDDLIVILKRALLAWLIADGDMHLKNMALLKIADPGAEHFRSVRLAPLYDTLTTRVFPRLAHDRMALKLNGKDDKLRRSDFQTLARTAGLKAADADKAIDALIGRLEHAIDRIALPALPSFGADIKETVEKMLEIIRSRLSGFK